MDSVEHGSSCKACCMASRFLGKICVPGLEDPNSAVINPFGTNRIAHAVESQPKYVQPGAHVSHTARSEGRR